MYVKIRIFPESELFEFKSRDEAFAWVRKNVNSPCVVSVLSYENGELESLDRYNYNGRRFMMENIRS